MVLCVVKSEEKKRGAIRRVSICYKIIVILAHCVSSSKGCGFDSYNT